MKPYGLFHTSQKTRHYLIGRCFSDWDLWGPLILCLALGIMLSVNVGEISLSPLYLPSYLIISGSQITITRSVHWSGRDRFSWFLDSHT